LRTFDGMYFAHERGDQRRDRREIIKYYTAPSVNDRYWNYVELD
jgi:hypothetical protein